MWTDDYELDISAFILEGQNAVCLDSWTVKLPTRPFVRGVRGVRGGS